MIIFGCMMDLNYLNLRDRVPLKELLVNDITSIVIHYTKRTNNSGNLQLQIVFNPF